MTRQVATDVYQQRLAHSKVVFHSGANLLVDTGPSSEWDDLKTFIEDRGGVNRLFLSHAHGDHVGNVEEVVEAYDPEVLIPSNEPFDDVDLSNANITEVEDGAELAEGIQVVEVPGHTKGICALYLPDETTLLATDVLDGSDRRGLPVGHLLVPPARYNWDSDLAEMNLERLLDLSFEKVVVTHGTNVDADARQKLDALLNFDEYYRKNLLERLAD